MADTVSGRYQKLLNEFAAKELPEFYRKYGRDQSTCDQGSFSAQYKESDLFPQTLPIERFLEIPGPIRKRKFFEDISVGHIVEGLVTDKWADILHVRLHSVYYGPKRWISDLKVKGECDLSEFKTHSGSRRLSDSISDFDIGDHVRGVIRFIDKKDWKITISFRRSLLPDHLSHTKLGGIEEERSSVLDDDDGDGVGDENGSKGYLHHLRGLPCFKNPELTSNLLRHLGIDTNRPCTFLESLSSEVNPDEYGHKLRERQSTKWSMNMVANGVQLFKESKHDEALKCFDQALQMHPKNVEALVARGALRANQKLLKSAIADFREALEIHPSHRNGRKYLCETLMTVAKQYEMDRLWKDASRCYKEALEIEPEHEVARERIHQIRIMLSQQVLAGKRKPVLDQGSTAKSLDVAAGSEPIKQSKSLIELLKKKVSKKAKKKKRKKSKLRKKGKKRKSYSHHRSDSSPTDSGGSDSEITESASEKPTSESESEWVEKTMDDKFLERQSGNSHGSDKQTNIPPKDVKSEWSEETPAQYRHRKLSGALGNISRTGEKTDLHRSTEKRKEAHKTSNKKGKYEQEHERCVKLDGTEKTDERERHASRRGSLEYPEKEIKRQRSHETMDRVAHAVSSASFSGEDFSHTHFSNDEITFINSLFKRKSNE